MAASEAFAPSMEIYGVGSIGGIESITLNGKRYYFGFSYSSDSVLSPLFSDIDVMAAFASRHMEQRDGLHNPTYWRELAEDSIESSDLTDDEGSRDFSMGRMQRISAALRQAQVDNIPIPGFKIEDHLLYLLAAASIDIDPFEDAGLANALSRLNLDQRVIDSACIDDAIAILNQSQRLPPGASYTDAAFAVQRYLDISVHGCPDNWKTLFLALASK